MTYQTFFPDHLPVLSLNGVSLEPLQLSHAESLAEAVQDGELYRLLVTSAPMSHKTEQYIQLALDQQVQGTRYAFAVLDQEMHQVIGSTSFYDIATDTRRVKIGYTWYAKRYQRTHVNTTCKFLLLQYAFEELQAKTVVFETDILNLASQTAIERLGAKKDGVLRGHKQRKDGTTRDTVVYSIVQAEWERIKAYLLYILKITE